MYRKLEEDPDERGKRRWSERKGRKSFNASQKAKTKTKKTPNQTVTPPKESDLPLVCRGGSYVRSFYAGRLDFIHLLSFWPAPQGAKRQQQ